MLTWVDGLAVDRIPVGDRGLAYGDGLFETVLVRDGRATLMQQHLARLRAGCERLYLPFDVAAMHDELNRFAHVVGEGVIKLTYTRGDGKRGYAVPIPATPRRILTASPLPSYPARNAEQGVALFPCNTRLAHQPMLAGLKHLNRLEQVLARAEWSDERFAEGLVRDAEGLVIEGVFTNLFMVEDGTLVTPSLSRCGVEGVMRNALIDAASACGIRCEVREISLETLLAVQEVFVCNSVVGIWPVTEFKGKRWSVGPLTRKMQGLSHQLLDTGA
ncbi:aminodeoxychorismate lyase [Pseudomonas sp. Marseille-QA0892]